MPLLQNMPPPKAVKKKPASSARVKTFVSSSSKKKKISKVSSPNKKKKIGHKKKTPATISSKKKNKVPPLSSKVRTFLSSSYSKKRSSSSQSPLTQTKVYVLELQGGYVYVGKTSRSIQVCAGHPLLFCWFESKSSLFFEQDRLREHMCSNASSTRFSGSAFTRLHPPTGRLLPRLGNLEGDGDGPERDETLRQMQKRGPQRVRGWKYVRPGPLTGAELDDIKVG
jgi:hypothetical protein